MNSPEYWIDKLALEPHPEGGYFKENYRSKEAILKTALPNRFTGDRSFSTAIYFLLSNNDISAFHRIKQDEIWHFYHGSPLIIHILDETKNYRASILGLDLNQEQQPQIVVEAGAYFAAEVVDKSSFTLVGCTVAPGFDFTDFEMPVQSKMIELFPKYKTLVKRLSR